jgi:formylmethanofuran dehydrogenase subunit B
MTQSINDSTGQLNVPDSPQPICTGCDCLCHDLEVSDSHKLILPEACQRLNPEIGQTSQSFDSQTIDAAILELKSACYFNRRIAITGLESLSLEAQKSALTLAESIGAWVIPVTGKLNIDPWVASYVQQGAWQATWSEIRARSDGLLLWYTAPWDSHPRWIERFGPKDHRAHKLAIVEPNTDVTASRWILRLEPAHALHFLSDLRIALKDPINEPAESRLRRLVHLFRNSKWLSIVRSEDPHGLIDPVGVAESLTALISEQNNPEHRVVTTEIPIGLNAAGLKSVLSWRTGLNLPVYFSPEGPVHRPGEISLSDFELVLAFSDRPAQWLAQCSNATILRFWSKSVEQTSSKHGQSLHIPMAPPGLGKQVTVVRADGIAISIPALHPDSRPTAIDVLIHLVNHMSETRIVRSDQS